jgi:hypothetical protein
MISRSLSALCDFLETAETSRLARVSEPTMRRWMNLGIVPGAVRIGPRVFRINRDAFLAWLNRGCPGRPTNGHPAAEFRG